MCSWGPNPGPMSSLLKERRMEIPAWGVCRGWEGSCPGGVASLWSMYALLHFGSATLSPFMWPECILFFHSSVLLLPLFPLLLFPLLGTLSCTCHFTLQCSNLSGTVLSMSSQALCIFPLYSHWQSFIEAIKFKALKALEMIWVMSSSFSKVEVLSWLGSILPKVM